MPTRLILLCLLVITHFSSSALAQVNGPGPSPSSSFDIVLNLPGDEAVITGGWDESIGGVQGQTTQLNVSDGATVGRNFSVNRGGELNISGGTVEFGLEANFDGEVNLSGGIVGSSFEAFRGVVNISGGTIDGFFRANSGSAVSISGGTIRSFYARTGSDLELIGDEFRLNGVAITDDTISTSVR